MKGHGVNLAKERLRHRDTLVDYAHPSLSIKRVSRNAGIERHLDIGPTRRCRYPRKVDARERRYSPPRPSTADDEEIRLTPTEWGIVELLVRNRDKLVTQRQVLQEVSGPQYGEETNHLRVHMAHIRRKLEPEQGRPRYFLTESGMGYRFHIPED